MALSALANLFAVDAAELSASAYHHSVVTPTGKVYDACTPRNSMVVATETGLKVVSELSSLYSIERYQMLQGRWGRDACQLSTTKLYRFQSVDDRRSVLYAPTTRAQSDPPPMETSMR